MQKIIILILAVAILAGLAILGLRKFKPATVPSAELKKGLVVYSPKANGLVASPLIVSGYVNGDGWIGFEAQVGTVSLYDNTGKLLVIKPLTATSEWMTSTIYFATDLEFATAAESGTVVFRNENPSGEPVRDKQLILPIRFK